MRMFHSQVFSDAKHWQTIHSGMVQPFILRNETRNCITSHRFQNGRSDFECGPDAFHGQTWTHTRCSHVVSLSLRMQHGHITFRKMIGHETWYASARVRDRHWVGFDSKSARHRIYFPNRSTVGVERSVAFEQRNMSTVCITTNTS